MSHSRRFLIGLTLAGGLAIAGCSSDSESGSTSIESPSSGAATTQTATPTTSPTASSSGSSPTASSPTAETAGGTATDPTATADPATTAAAPDTAASTEPASTAALSTDQFVFTDIASVSNPVDLVYRVDDPAAYIVSADGFIVAMHDGVLDETKLLDVADEITSGGEQGLLGMTFSVDGTKAYVNYTNLDGDTEVVEYAVDADGVFDPASKRLLLMIDQPYANHNGGQVRIGPDGLLYIGMGDGGSGGDPERRALNTDTLLGKMLRIDPTPSADAAYTIPADNPFVGVDGARPEIYAIGLRNPWRYSFDMATDDLWIADVGQGEWEEIDVAWAADGGGNGANFGWSAFEGTHPFNPDQPSDGVTMPIFEYEHGTDCSVSGGVRYRGSALPSLSGYYVYADYCSGEVRAFPVLDDRTAGAEFTLTTDLSAISEVAQDPAGELYVLSFDGTVYALQPVS